MDFTRKARFVAGGNTTTAPAALTYASVVSRESVRIVFTLAAVNDLDVMGCDIGNAYLNAPCREKIWFVAGPECGEHKGKVCKLVRALYGLKSSGVSWRQMFSDYIRDVLKFEPTTMDPDVYIRKSVRAHGDSKPPGDHSAKPGGESYYEYLLVYVDDVLVFSKNPAAVMEQLEKDFAVKGTPGPPSTFLGAGISKVTRRGIEYWSMHLKR